MGSKYTPAQKRATDKYMSSTDEIRVHVKKGLKPVVKEHAAKNNETMSGFVERAVLFQMEEDNKK